MLIRVAQILQNHKPAALWLYLGLFLILATISLPDLLKKVYAILDSWLSQKNRALWLVIALIVIVGGYFCLRNIWGYQAYQFGVYDYGIYNQMLSRITFGMSPDIAFIQEPHWLGDHFQPILYLLTPLAWLFSSSYTLLLIEPIFFVSGAFALFLIGRKYKLPSVFLVAIVASYLFYTDNIAALSAIFHPSTFVAPLILWSFWCYLNEQWIGYAILMLLALMTKEDVGLFLLTIGLWQLIFTRHKFVGIMTAVAAATWSGLAVGVFVPYFHHGPYVNAHVDPSLTQDSGIFRTFFHHPFRIFQVATNTIQKRIIISRSFAFFGLLPFLSSFVFVVTPFFAERLISDNSNRAQLTFHYGSPVSAILGIATVLSLSTIVQRYPKYIPTAAMLLISGTILSYMFFLPPLSDMGKLHQRTKSEQVKNLNAAVALIPRKATVIAQDSIAAHLPAQPKIIQLDVMPMSDVGKIDYIIADFQTSNGPIPSPEEMKHSFRTVANDPDYGLIYSKGSAAVWRKGVKNQTQLSPEMQAYLAN